jgi:integrase
MVQSIHAVLRNALQTAVREEIVPRNVARLVKVSTPKYKVNRGLTVPQARAVLAAAYDEPLCALYVLALCLGLRRGELLGLTPLEPDDLRRSWGRIRKAAKIDGVRFHDIRHTCVSPPLDLGVPPHIVRDIVGHSDIEVTMTIYAHAALGKLRNALS